MTIEAIAAQAHDLYLNINLAQQAAIKAHDHVLVDKLIAAAIAAGNLSEYLHTMLPPVANVPRREMEAWKL